MRPYVGMGLAGTALGPREYLAEFELRAGTRHGTLLKLGRQQDFRRPGSPSWSAADRGHRQRTGRHGHKNPRSVAGTQNTDPERQQHDHQGECVNGRKPQPVQPATPQMVALYKAGYSAFRVGASVGIGRNPAARRLRAAGVTLRKPGGLPPDSKSRTQPATPEMVKAYTDGASAKTVGAMVGVSDSTARAMLRLAGVTMRDSGGTPPGWKQTPATPAMIKAYTDGASSQAIADATPGLGQWRVLAMLRAAGVPIRPRSFQPRNQFRETTLPASPSMVSAYYAGSSIRDVAESNGMSKSSARLALLAAGVTLRAPGAAAPTGRTDGSRRRHTT